MVERIVYPVRSAIGVLAPLLAAAALATFVVWERSVGEADWAAPVSLVGTCVAFVTSAWAILVATSRALQIVGVAALIVSVLTAVLWWSAISGILETT